MEERPAGLLFCPAEEALLGRTAPLTQLAESCLGGAREGSVTLAPYFFPPPIALPLQCFAGGCLVSAPLPCSDFPE